MGDTKTEILEASKVLLGIDNDESDKLIMLLIDEVTDAVLSYCRLEVLPRQLMSFIPTLVAERFAGNKNAGVKSITEGERRVEYCEEDYDFLAAYAARLRPFVSRKVKVPSDLDAKEENNDKSV